MAEVVRGCNNCSDLKAACFQSMPTKQVVAALSEQAAALGLQNVALRKTLDAQETGGNPQVRVLLALRQMSVVLSADKWEVDVRNQNPWSKLRGDMTFKEVAILLTPFGNAEKVGVGVDERGVWGLFLSNKQLEGPLPDFGCFSELREVHLNNNKLTGPVPSFRHCDKLKLLMLYGNALEGPVPVEHLPVSEIFRTPINTTNPNLMLGTAEAKRQQVALLVRLRSMSSVLREDKDWAHLREDMSLEEVGEVPLGGVIHLDGAGICSVFLSNKQLEGVVPDFSCCSRLDCLWLDRNSLHGPLPPAWPSSLKILCVSHNQRLHGKVSKEMILQCDIISYEGCRQAWECTPCEKANGEFMQGPFIVGFSFASQDMPGLLANLKALGISSAMLRDPPAVGDPRYTMFKTHGDKWCAWQEVWLDGLEAMEGGSKVFVFPTETHFR
jgi:hypothetical protein